MVGTRYAMIIVASLLFVFLFATSIGGATTYIVDDDWDGADFNDISSATLAMEAGDTLLIYDGQYSSDGDWYKKSYTIIGNGSDTVFLGEPGNSAQVRIAGEGSYLRGVTIHTGSEYGIILEYPKADVLIEDVFIKGKGGGIDVSAYWPTNYTIRNCSIDVGKNGLVFHGDNGTIENCDINAGWDAVRLNKVRNSVISGCFLEADNEAIDTYHAVNNIIRDCTIVSNRSAGFVGSNSWNNTLQNVAFNRTGIRLDPEEILNLTIENCTVDGRPIVLLNAVNDTVLDTDAGQLFLFNCNNITINNGSVPSDAPSMLLQECTNVTIEDLKFTNRTFGIVVNGSEDIIIDDCSFAGIDSYAIEGSGMTIKNSFLSNSTGSGIRLRGYGAVRNCTLTGLKGNAIFLEWANRALIEGCEIYDINGSGIDILMSEKCNITNTKVMNSTFRSYWSLRYPYYYNPSTGSGINLGWGTRGTRIDGCEIFNNSGYGLSIDRASSTMCVNTTLIDDGVKIKGSSFEVSTHSFSNVTVNGLPFLYLVDEGNKTITGDYGQVVLVNCTNIEITEMAINYTDVGIDIMYSESIDITNVTTYRLLEGITVSSSEFVNISDCHFVSQIHGLMCICYAPGNVNIAMRSTGNSTISNCTLESALVNSIDLNNCNDVTISGGRIKESRGNGIYLFAGHNNTIHNISISDCDEDGLKSHAEHNLTLTDIKVYRAAGSGIQFHDSTTVVSSSVVTGCERGVYIEDYSLSTIEIYDSVFTDNRKDGLFIDLYRTDDGNRIHNVTSSGNGGNGLFLSIEYCIVTDCNFSDNNRTGLRLDWVRDVDIGNNIISRNNGYGIHIMGSSVLSSEMSITENTFDENIDYGIYVHGSATANIIYNNSFLNNGGNNSQGYWDSYYSHVDRDEGINGNYWSDYIGTDIDGDGIGETPYLLDGPDATHDHRPIGGDKGNVSIQVALTPTRPVPSQWIEITINITIDFDWPQAVVQLIQGNRELNETTVDLVEGSNEILFRTIIHNEGEQKFTIQIASYPALSSNVTITAEEVEIGPSPEVEGRSPYFTILGLVVLILIVYIIDKKRKL